MTQYYKFEQVNVVGAWADSEDEARGYVADGQFDIIRIHPDPKLIAVCDEEEDGCKPFANT